MALQPGTRLGPYEVVSPIGAGGMGEVYRGRDTRLDRTIAIKVLPPHVASDPQLRDRFEREARTISQLDHPHICTLHDVGHHDGVAYLVLEFLQGETLAHRLTKGPLPLDQALTIAGEIADALDSAHRQNIVHRDLKPGNIMLTKSGAKLLDFGLAKIVLPGSATVPGLTALPTEHAPLTAQGTILGTLQYMSPEQLEGREADTRSDVFAFGAILYEMVSGQRAFQGKSQASLIAAILEHDPPPLSAAQPLAPALLDRVVRRCLEKEPDKRWQNIQDAALPLGWIKEQHAGPEAVLPKPRRSPARWAIGAAVAWAVAASVVAGLLWFTRGSARDASTASPSVMRFVVAGPPATANVQGGLPTFALARDGSVYVYVGTEKGVSRLFRRRLTETTATPIPGTEGATVPFLSPDGRTVGFTAGGRLRTVSIEGGSPITVAPIIGNRGASWGADGNIIFSSGTDSGLWRVAATGGTPQSITQPDAAKNERTHRWPFVVGNRVLYTVAKSDILSFDDATIVVRDLATGEERELIRGGSFPLYESGHLLYARAGNVLAVPVDEAMNVTGPAVTVLNNVVTYPATGAAEVATATNGLMLSIDGGASQNQNEVAIVDRRGNRTVVPFPPAAFQDVRVSPNGRTLALGIDNANASIWLGDPGRATATRLTLAWSNNGPFLSPDGSRVAYSSGRGGVRNLFWQATDGSGAPERLTNSAHNQALTSWSRDGRYMAFNSQAPGAPSDVHVLDLQEGRKERPLISSQYAETGAVFSPDTQFIAYVSDESGTPEVYLQRFPDGRNKERVSRDGGTNPVWAKDGSELYYRKGDAMMAVGVTLRPNVTLTSPRTLFELPRHSLTFDVMADGRFVMIGQVDSPLRTAQLTATLNWPVLLKKQ